MPRRLRCKFAGGGVRAAWPGRNRGCPRTLVSGARRCDNWDTGMPGTKCIDCQKSAPHTETQYTLISKHRWRVTRIRAPGRRAFEWRCPACWAAYKARRPQASSQPPAGASRPPDAPSQPPDAPSQPPDAPSQPPSVSSLPHASSPPHASSSRHPSSSRHASSPPHASSSSSFRVSAHLRASSSVPQTPSSAPPAPGAHSTSLPVSVPSRESANRLQGAPPAKSKPPGKGAP